MPTIQNDAGAALPASAVGNPFLFTAREWDRELSLYYFRARYYQPTLCRFLSRDPLGYLPDANLYRYVSNNPLRYVDPLGFEKEAHPSHGEILFTVGIGGTFGGSPAPFILPSVFIGSSLNIGLTSALEPFIQVQASYLGGWGIFGGIG